MSAGGTVTAQLDDLTGVDTAEWALVATDETSSPGAYALAVSGPKNSIATTTALLPGTAGILQCRINGGINKATQRPDPGSTIARAKFFVPAANGREVICAGELLESDPTYGYTGLVNSALRTQVSNVSVTTLQSQVATLQSQVSALPTAVRLGGAVGAFSTDQGATSPLVIGAIYYDATFKHPGASFRLSAVLMTNDPTYLAKLALYDVAGVTMGGVPGYVPGANLSSSAVSSTLTSTTLPAFGTAPSGLFEVHLWLATTAANKRATCLSAFLDILP